MLIGTSRPVVRSCWKNLKPAADEEITVTRLNTGRGCAACRHKGYKGRIAFHELAVVTEEMRGIIGRGGDLDLLTASARRAGYQPLRYDGLKKVLLGLTTIEELEANAPFEWTV